MLDANNPYMLNPTNSNTVTNPNTTIDTHPTTATIIDNKKDKSITSIATQNANDRRIGPDDPISNHSPLYSNNHRHPQQPQQRYSNNINTMAIKRESAIFNNYVYNNKPPTPISATSSTSISSPTLPGHMRYQSHSFCNSDSQYQQSQQGSGRWYTEARPTTAHNSIRPPPPPPPPSTTLTKEKDSLDGNIRYTNHLTTSASTSTTATTTTNYNNKKNKRRKEMTKYMENLNEDFLKNKERIYLDRLDSIQQELLAARQDQHPVYIESLRDLEQKRKKTIEEFALFREYQIKVTDRQFQLEIYQAEEEYTAEKQEAREKLYNMLEEKRRKLKEEKDNCDLSYDVMLETQSRSHKRTLRKRGADHPENKSSKKKQTVGPSLVCALKEDDILADLQAMRQGTTYYDTAYSSGAISSSNYTSPLKKNTAANKRK